MKVTRLIAPFVAAAALIGFSNVHALTLELDMENVPAVCNGGWFTPLTPGSGGAAIDIGGGFQISFDAGYVDVCEVGMPFTVDFDGNFLAAPNPAQGFRLEAIDGGPFTLNSFGVDMMLDVATEAEIFAGVTGATVQDPPQVTMESSAGVSVTFTTDGQNNNVELETFSNFNNVTYIDFTTPGGIGFDNLSVTASEPGTLAAFGLGLMVLAGARRRRRRAA